MENSLSFKTPIGWMVVEEQVGKIWSVGLPHTEGDAAAASPQNETPLLGEARKQILQYFAGERTSFDLPMADRGTDFQQSVWQVMRTIGFGQTLSYAELADNLGSTGKARAVGAACGKNPFLLINPCHRVVASGGLLGGFSAGGVTNKRQLLLHEGINFAD